MTAVEDVHPPGHGTPEAHVGTDGTRTPEALAPRTDHREVWESVVDVFGQAADTPKIAEPVGRIEQVVLLRSLDVRDSGVLLVARGGRLEVRDAGASSSEATIELALRTPDLERLAAGHLRAAMAIASGRATYAGPVREFLRVLPLVQAMVNPPAAMGTNTEDLVQEIA